MRLPDAVARFIDHCKTAKSLSPNSVRAYTADLDDFASRLQGTRRRGPQVHRINRDGLRAYAASLADRRLKPATIRRRMASVRLLFRWLEREEHLPLTPFHRLELSIRVPHRLPKALAAPEMRRLLAAAEKESCFGYQNLLMHFAVVTLFATGLRVGEFVAIETADLDVVGGAIQVRGKGNRERRVPLLGKQETSILKRFLAARRKIDPPGPNVLVTDAGHPITTQYVRRRLTALAVRAGLARRVTPHMLRHTAATHLIEARVDITYVRKLLGHSSIATTQIYTHVSDRSLRAQISRAKTLDRLRRDDN